MAEAKKVTHQRFRKSFEAAEVKFNNGPVVNAPGPAASFTAAELNEDIEAVLTAVATVKPFLGWLPGKYSQPFIALEPILKSVAKQLK